MKSKIFFQFALAGVLGVLSACDGILNFSSQTSNRSETKTSENSQTITNGDTSTTTSDKKSKTNSESETRGQLDFSAEDKTGITDEVRKNLKENRKKGDSTDTDEPKSKTTKKDTKPPVKLKSNIVCGQAISGDEFENAKAKITEIRMDIERIRVGKEIFNELCISTKQAQELVSILSLESYKLEFAKFLYGRTTNKDNFMRVADEFSFEDTKKKLSNYINE